MNSCYKMFALLLLVAVTSVACKPGGKTLAKVGGETITQSDIDKILRANPRLKTRLNTPEGKQKLLENYVEQLLLYQEGLRRNLHRNESVKDRIDLYKTMILAQAALDDELDKKVKEYYENHKDEFERVKIAHLLISYTPAGPEAQKNKKPVRTLEQANALMKKVQEQLQKGESFEKLTEQFSEDERTKKSGGELGYVALNDRRMDGWGWNILIEKALSMKEGEISDPMSSKNGVHLVKLLEAKTMEPFDQAENRIRFRIQGTVRNELLENLKKKTKIKYIAEGDRRPKGDSPKGAESAPAAESQPGGPAHE